MAYNKKDWSLTTPITPEELNRMEQGIADNDESITNHKNDFDNPHNVTAEQINTYTKNVIDNKVSTVESALTTHVNNTENPHNVTASQIGAYTKEEANEKFVDKTTYNQDKETTDETIEEINERISGETSTETVTGYDILSLPEEANGQVSSVELRGQTATNLIENGDFRDGTKNWRGYRGTINAEGDILTITGYDDAISPLHIIYEYSNKLYANHKYYISVYMITDSDDGSYHVVRILARNVINRSISSNNWYRHSAIFTQEDDLESFDILYLFGFVRSGEKGGVGRIRTPILIDLTALGLEDKTVEELDEMFPYYFEGTKSTVGAIRIRSTSEDETQGSIQYITAKDPETNEIVNLRSLPNGVSDRIYRGTDGKWYLEKNIEDSTQLSSPIIKEIDVKGDLTVYPSGTIYIEPVIKTTAIYNDGIISELPIQTIEKITKIDVANGISQELDINDATISDDKMTIYHPELENGDTVEYIYYYDPSITTTPEVTITYYNEERTVKTTLQNIEEQIKNNVEAVTNLQSKVQINALEIADNKEKIDTALNNITTITSELDDAEGRIEQLETDIQKTFVDLTYTISNGHLTFYRKDGTTKVIDLPLEMIIESGRFDEETNTIILTMANQQTIEIPVGAVVTDISEALHDVEENLNLTQAELNQLQTDINNSITAIQNELNNKITLNSSYGGTKKEYEIGTIFPVYTTTSFIEVGEPRKIIPLVYNGLLIGFEEADPNDTITVLKGTWVCIGRCGQNYYLFQRVE